MEFYKNVVQFFKSIRRKNKDDIIKYYGISTGFFLGMILMSFVIYAIATPLLNAFQ
ncbi:hypothetical protein_gp161 [Bacillus phage vB_BceM_WH1]|nr:hypothetical protein_gp161 [Bacillus phage vB_BceM_WH1]